MSYQDLVHTSPCGIFIISNHEHLSKQQSDDSLPTIVKSSSLSVIQCKGVKSMIEDDLARAMEINLRQHDEQ